MKKVSGVAKQKRWFEKLKIALGNDLPLYTCRNWRQNDKFKPGKQEIVGRILPPLDHRTIGSTEIVIELDAKTFAQNAKYAQQIKDYCVSQEIPTYCFWSGNKSIHIHIWLEIDIQSQEGNELIKKAYTNGCNIFRDLRLKLVREIIDQCGFPESIIGQGKIVDLAKLNWDDIGGKHTLIRACGGHNKKVDKVTGDITGGFKTQIIDIPKKKPKDNTFEDVEYPDIIHKWDVPEEDVIKIAHDFIQNLEATRDKKVVSIDYKGKHMTLPCVHAIMEGLGSGKRSYGALILGIAARMDGLLLPETKQIIQQYVANCPQIPEPFKVEEAEHWLNWVYKQPTSYWACGQCIKLGICDKIDCELHKNQYKEELELFNQNEPLAIIKKALDQLVVGEDELKMQLFLLFLTKEFNPEWAIIIDGPGASGKTHTMKAVASLFGEEGQEFFVYSRMTGASLNHLGELAEQWKKKIVIIEELQGSRDVTEQLRVAISEGRLNLAETKEVLSADGTKEFQTKNKEVIFGNLFVTCNAEGHEDGDQLLSRSWILNTDTGNQQTENIIKYYLKKFSKPDVGEVENLHTIRTAIQFLKKPKEIIFEGSEELENWLPKDAVRARRDIKKLIALIEASAFFHQTQRRWDGEVLYADWRDVKVAYNVAGHALYASTQGLGSQDVKDWQIVIAKTGMAQTRQFNKKDVMRWLACKDPTARKRCMNWAKAGFITNTSQFGHEAVYELNDHSVSVYDPISFNKLVDENIKNEQVLSQDSRGVTGVTTCYVTPITANSKES